MFKKCLLVSFLVLSGCNDTMDYEKAVKLINLKNEGSCTYISLSPEDIQYNTSTRTYNTNDKTIRVSASLESFSIPEKTANEKHINQLIVLEREGLVKHVADYVTPIEPGLYVSDVEGAPSDLIDIGRSKGVQYQLTKLGKSYFSVSLGNAIPRVCVGYEKVDDLILNRLPDDNGDFTAVYTVKMGDIPDWINTPTVENYFPTIKEMIKNIESEQKTAVFIKEGNKYILKENK